jgi:hypothetical protein
MFFIFIWVNSNLASDKDAKKAIVLTIRSFLSRFSKYSVLHIKSIYQAALLWPNQFDLSFPEYLPRFGRLQAFA